VLGGAELHDLAVLHDRHPVPEPQSLVEVVRHEDDGPLDLALDVQEKVLHVAPDQGVQSTERLVHEQNLLLGGQGAGEPHPLLHAPRKLRAHLAALALETHHLQSLLASFPAFVGRHSLNLKTEGYVVEDGAVRQKPKVLEDHPDLATPELPELLDRHFGDVVTVQVYFALGRIYETVDQT
jgi:hypothetical protein